MVTLGGRQQYITLTVGQISLFQGNGIKILTLPELIVVYCLAGWCTIGHSLTQEREDQSEKHSMPHQEWALWLNGCLLSDSTNCVSSTVLWLNVCSSVGGLQSENKLCLATCVSDDLRASLCCLLWQRQGKPTNTRRCSKLGKKESSVVV